MVQLVELRNKAQLSIPTFMLGDIQAALAIGTTVHRIHFSRQLDKGQMHCHKS